MTTLPDPVTIEGVRCEPVVLWKALCADCGHDLMQDTEYAAMGPEAQEAFDYCIGQDGFGWSLDFCPNCHEPLTDNGRALREEEAEADA